MHQIPGRSRSVSQTDRYKDNIRTAQEVMQQVRACPCRNVCSMWLIYSGEGMACLGACRRQADCQMWNPCIAGLKYIGANGSTIQYLLQWCS